MATIARETDFECVDWGCSRIATQYNFRSPQSYKDEGKDMVKLFADNLLCNIHAGVIKRQMNGRNWSSYKNENLSLITALGSHWDEAKAAYLKARAEQYAEARAKDEAKRAEQQQENIARFAQMWVERSTEDTFNVNRGTDRESYADRFRDGYTVMQEGANKNTWSNVGILVEQDGKQPATVKCTSMGTWSPAQARAVAQALILAANIADERDILNGPIVKEA